jgi:hypothetical protein
MTGTPTDPEDANHTTLYDPPPPTPAETPAPPPETPGPPPETSGSPPETSAAPPETSAAPPETSGLPADAPATAAPPPTAPSPTTPRSGPMWRSRDNDGRTGTIVLGVILVAIGLWFFGDQTLGLDMPELSWSELWPILIIGLGGWIVLGSLRRDA